MAEVVLTFFFLLVILGATDRRAPAGFAPIAIGLALTLIHLVGIPVTNTSVNPARSTAPALFVGGWALAQLWLFWVAPIAGAAVAGRVHRWLAEPTLGDRIEARRNGRRSAWRRRLDGSRRWGSAGVCTPGWLFRPNRSASLRCQGAGVADRESPDARRRTRQPTP